MALELLKTFALPPQWAPRDQMCANLYIGIPFSVFLTATDAYCTAQVIQSIDNEHDGLVDWIMKRAASIGFGIATLHHLHNTLRFVGIEPITTPVFFFCNQETRDSAFSTLVHAVSGAPAIALYLFYLLSKYERNKQIVPSQKMKLRLFLLGGLLATPKATLSPQLSQSW
eukprot:CAMPEP_0197037218 /NCGR_PEP_ID=MMETSP1384-20130603/14478_1 /TAXON_ID=29189 /ORGANISM="Ammonia sp." /LENGTH=169 /DNA_ID=CAMNT_0042467489 /DNA_START=41 /DNA_END=547 /DNA_ORIENTATION=+